MEIIFGFYTPNTCLGNSLIKYDQAQKIDKSMFTILKKKYTLQPLAHLLHIQLVTIPVFQTLFSILTRNCELCGCRPRHHELS